MKRKVVKHGYATLTVSLPSKWARNYGIKAGDEVEVEAKGGELIIKGGILSMGEKDISVSSSTVSFLRSIISNSYKKGYDLINVQFEDYDVMPKISEIVDGLLGFEIIEQGKKRCTIKNVADALESEFDSLFRKSFFMMFSMSDIISKDLSKCKFDNLNEILQLKKNITKLTDFCKRILNKKKRNNEDFVFIYLIVWSVEKIANQYKYIYEYLAKYKPKKISKETINFFKKTNELFKLFYEGFYEKNNDKIKKCTEIKDKMIYDEFYELNSKIERIELPIIYYSANIIRRIQDMTGPYFGYVL